MKEMGESFILHTFVSDGERMTFREETYTKVAIFLQKINHAHAVVIVFFNSQQHEIVGMPSS